MQPIVTLTVNPSIDISTTVGHVVPERKLRCGPPRREPGGGGLNVSRAIHRLGGASSAYYFSGGATGELLQSLLELEDLRHHPIDVEDLTRENTIVFEESTGLQYRFGMPGPRSRPADWEKTLDLLRSCHPAPSWLVVSGSLPPGMPDDFYARVAEVGHGHGAKVIVDTSGPALGLAARQRVFLLKPNLRELSVLVGRELEDDSAQEQAARELVTSGRTEAVVVSLGAGGAMLVTAEGCTRYRTPTVPVRSKVGAGDSMVGGIVLASSRGWELIEAVRFGVAAGAAAVMTEGSELCRRDDTERLYEAMRTRGE